MPIARWATCHCSVGFLVGDVSQMQHELDVFFRRVSVDDPLRLVVEVLRLRFAVELRVGETAKVNEPG